MAYKFYYDETEHSRRINLNTLIADNYYDNFTTVIVGWDEQYSSDIERRYVAFENKYRDRFGNGEIKSTSLKLKQFKYGLSSVHDDNIEMINDFLDVFDDNVFWCFSVQSKVEYIIHQLFDGFIDDDVVDMRAMQYTIIKAINTYKPSKVMESIYERPDRIIEEMKTFLQERIEKNKQNIELKASENNAFEQLLFILKGTTKAINTEWDYHIPFDGFRKFLEEKKINEYGLVIDREGSDHKTLCAALEMGLQNVSEEESKESIGIRVADMLAGILSKMMKAIHKALESNYEKVEPVFLNKNWFSIDKARKDLYKKLHYVISTLNDAEYKSYAGLYVDDLISFIALLEFIDERNEGELKDNEITEKFNDYALTCLYSHFLKFNLGLPIKGVTVDDDGSSVNAWGAKVFVDASQQPGLEIENGMRECMVVDAGVDRKGIPTVTIEEDGKFVCYRIPEQLAEWVIDIISLKKAGISMLPSRIKFFKQNGKWIAE